MNRNTLTLFSNNIFAGILSFIILSYPLSSYAEIAHEQVVIIELEGLARFVLITPKQEKIGVEEYEVYQEESTPDLSLSTNYQRVRIVDPDSGNYEILLSSRYPDEVTTAHLSITFIKGGDPNIFFREWEYILTPGHQQKIIFEIDQKNKFILFNEHMDQSAQLTFLKKSSIDELTFLQWDAIPGVQKYRVYTKRENIDYEWNLLAETDENTLLLDNHIQQIQEVDSLYTEYTVVAEFSDKTSTPRLDSIFSHDRDNDYLPDDYEVATGSNPNERDTDADGLIDSYELNIFHSDPTVSDTDGDGYNDLHEVLQYTGLLNEHSHPQGGCIINQNILTIENECTIDAEKIVVDTILVNSSSTLTLENNSRIYLNNAKSHIIIRQGGKIIVNNSRIILNKF